MRKLFFTLALVFVVSLTYASNTIENKKEVAIEIVKSESILTDLNKDQVSEFEAVFFFDCSSEANSKASEAQSQGGNYYEAWFKAFGECVSKEYEESE
jgi:hypothetical protein